MISAMGKNFDIQMDMKKKIDEMTKEQMARELRFASIGSPMMIGDTYRYLKAKFDALGGWTPELSKSIGY